MSFISTLWLVVLAALAAHFILFVVVAGAKALCKILDNWIVKKDTWRS